MRYEGSVYRPPSEADSLIIQLTIGCARNKCTFCEMYKDKKFRIRDLDEVVEDLYMARSYYRVPIRKIFLADGDALIVKTKDLLYIFDKIHEIFPEVQRITMYAATKDILHKTDEELKALKDAGLYMVYVGFESGDNDILKHVKKDLTAEEIIEGGLKIKKSGILLSATLISGLGGREKLIDHAVKSAQLINAIKPDYLGYLTLMLRPGMEMYDELMAGKFELLTADEVLEEMRIFLLNVDSEGTVFRSNHASNYVNLAGTLNKDREKLLAVVDKAVKNKIYKPEFYRGL